jgi:inorganic phosphate transporter, PiT family
MTFLAFAGLVGAALLAFANGANDISKSIATLVGSGEARYRKAVVVVSFAVALGAVTASAWAVKMTLLFTKGMLSPQVQVNQVFALAVLGGAIGWVLLATRLRLPVSTTHAIVGSVVLTGFYAFGFDNVIWSRVTRKIALPLILSPFLAYGLAALIFKFLFWLCRQKYCVNCHLAHWMSAVASGFARGLNDTPKIAALGLAFYGLLDPAAQVPPRWFFLILALANAAGGLTAGLRVTDTLAHRVTRMDHLDGFAANLATSVLVVLTAVKGYPVSTTHVSSSAIMGMGLQKGRCAVNWPVVGQIAAAWLMTLPAAGLISVSVYGALSFFP